MTQAAIRPEVLEAANERPGMRPLDPADWLWVDDAYPGQMALRDRLIAGRPDEVMAAEPGSDPAADELLDVVLASLAGPRDRVGTDWVARPDGVSVAIDRTAPLATLGRLVAEDLCVLERRGDEHVLTAAVLCFPSRWRLAEKMGRPLTRIHAPVAPYDDDLARRVQRLFEAIRPDRPLWRANLLRHHDPALFQPVGEGEKAREEPRAAAWIRSERQCLLRLPATGAVVFSIHTTVVAA